MCEKHNEIVSNNLLDKCKTKFIEEFDKVNSLNPQIEQEIFQIPGLVTKLFAHIHKKNNKKRKVTFVVEEFQS
jgi:hypothetical protein